MNLEKVLSLIPPDMLAELAIETEVDVFSKKLQGEVVFKLLLHCIISHKDNSLRTMESAYETLFFAAINQNHHQKSIRYNSISKRLSDINPDYFEKLFFNCVSLYKEYLGKDKENIIRFDSTIVSLSSRLLKVGYDLKGGGNAANIRQLKFTIGYSNGIAEKVQFFTSQRYTSENVALKEAVLMQSVEDKTRTTVFDRGITSRDTYDELTEDNIRFVSRLSDKAKYEITQPSGKSTKFPVHTTSLSILSDDLCYLYGTKGKKSKYLYRRIEAIRIADGNQIVFVTNNLEMEPEDVTEIYRRRWDIEVFFKFIKQLFNFSHLVNRSENGIKVILYVTMIAAILLSAYRKETNQTGYKIPKLKFANELETEIIKHLITLCGGDPEKLYAFLLCNSS